MGVEALAMLGQILGSKEYLDRVCREIESIDPAQVEVVSTMIEVAYRQRRFVFLIGNGGSGANDEGYDRIFVEPLKNLASPGNVLLAISGSGDSPNVLRAVEWANHLGKTMVGIPGFAGGQLKRLGHHQLPAGVDDMGMVESLHKVVFPWILDDLNRRFADLTLNAGAVL